VLVDVAGGLRPGTALDLGCGDGSDAIWLAAQGWRVTSVDISATALARAAERADAAVVAGVDWQRHDLTRTFPDGSFDLVSAQFLHSMVEFPRDDVLRTAAGTVAPGGTLLVVGHLTMPPWGNAHDHAVPGHEIPGHEIPDVEELFPTAERVLKALDLPAEHWRTVRADVAERQVTAPDGRTATITDSVVALTRIVPPPADCPIS
jgi:SAM-dependent methyltransferase